MKVKRLGIHNFRHFVDLEIEFDERLNVFVGINGSGKTSILNVLAIMLSRLIGRIQSPDPHHPARQKHPNASAG